MFDCHIHTKFSTDCNMSIEEVIEKSKSLGIGAIITDHMDYNFPRPGEFIFDIGDYLNEYSKYKNDKLLLGIEMGMMPESLEKNTCLSKSFDFDYIIGSIHLVNMKDLYDKNTYDGISKKNSYEEYLKSMFDCVKNHDYFDCLGHIDYICRYSIYDNREININEYSYFLDEILKVLAAKGKAIEINTRRFNEKAAVQSLLNICKRFYELGGRTAVLGSDSHNKESIGSNFHIGNEVAETSGLKLIYFKNRKPFYL